MARARAWINRFWRDEKGAFATIFGILLVVIVATAGAVVDFVGVQQARTKAQVALDAAALALQPNIYDWSDEDLKSAAEDLVIERLADDAISVDVEEVETDTDEGSLYFKVKLNVPTVFVAMVNIPSMDVRLASQATQRHNRLEVAMVLDNSGSMNSYSRMTNLKTAATNAVDILFDGQTTLPDVFVGLVPFNFFVNVGPGAEFESWMANADQAPSAWDNFDNDDDESTAPSGSIDRFALFSGLTNVSWKGCVETRPYPYDTDDTEPTLADPDSLYFPMFQPDNPDSGGYSWDYVDDDGGTCPGPTLDGYCEYKSWQYGTWPRRDSDYYTDSTKTTLISSGANACNCSGQTLTYDNWYWGGAQGWTHEVHCNVYTYPSLSDRELQERICKYAGASVSSTSNYQGPNASCLDAELLPLNNNSDTVKTEINAMVADGGTNIHTATAWGWRVLSPTEPYTEGDDYGTTTHKVMIVMTDGENTHYPSGSNMNCASYYTAYAFPWNERLGECGDSTNTLEGLMNDRTLETCENAKDAGVEIFTIGLEPPNSTTQNMLTDCATDPSHAYFPSAASELNDVFADIANTISKLRLSL